MVNNTPSQKNDQNTPGCEIITHKMVVPFMVGLSSHECSSCGLCESSDYYLHHCDSSVSTYFNLFDITFP